MKKIVLTYFIFFTLVSGAQNEFDKYGPMGCIVWKDLKEAIKSKSKIYKMDLSYQKLEPKVYAKLSTCTDLMALKLRGNSITTYPEGFNNLIYLAYFSSYANELSTFPPKLGSFASLDYLELQNTKIDSIPSEIVYLKKLKTLKFGNTDDTLGLPKTLRYMKNLKEVFLENVIMDSLPKQLFKIPNLNFLYLSNTNTHYLPGSFEKLPNLEVLIIENNPLSKIPMQIYQSQKLRFISLRNNKLTSIPETITELNELSLLDLRGNPIPQEEIEKLRALLPGCEVRF